MKKYFFLFFFILLFLFASCSSSDELNTKAFEYATIECFLNKDEDSHIQVYNEESLNIIDKDDDIYLLLKNIRLSEISNAAYNDGKYFTFLYYERKNDVIIHFYSNESIFEIISIIDGHLSDASCSRYFKINNDDSSNLIKTIYELSNE